MFGYNLKNAMKKHIYHLPSTYIRKKLKF